MRKIIIVLCLFSVTGCFQRHIIVDKKGVDLTAYKADLAECKVIADEVNVSDEVVVSAVSGSIVQAIFASVFGNSTIAGKGAVVGAVGGASRGVNNAQQLKDRVVRNCLKERGYRVLN